MSAKSQLHPVALLAVLLGLALVWLLWPRGSVGVPGQDLDNPTDLAAPAAALSVDQAGAAEEPASAGRTVIEPWRPPPRRPDLVGSPDIQRPHGTPIRVFLVRDDGGTPIRGAALETKPEGKKAKIVAYSNKVGIAEVTLDPGVEKARLAARATGLVSLAQPRLITPLQPEVEMRFRPRYAVDGHVLDATGAPVKGAEIALVSRQLVPDDNDKPAALEVATTDAQGRFSFEITTSQTEGTQLTISSSIGLPAVMRLDSLPFQNGRAYVKVKLDAGLTLRGRVLDTLGQPVPACTLRAWEASMPLTPDWAPATTKPARLRPAALQRFGARVHEFTTADDGSFTLPHWRAEATVVRLETEDGDLLAARPSPGVTAATTETFTFTPKPQADDLTLVVERIPTAHATIYGQVEGGQGIGDAIRVGIELPLAPLTQDQRRLHAGVHPTWEGESFKLRARVPAANPTLRVFIRIYQQAEWFGPYVVSPNFDVRLPPLDHASTTKRTLDTMRKLQASGEFLDFNSLMTPGSRKTPR